MKIMWIGIVALTCLAGILMTGCSTGIYSFGTGPIVQKNYSFSDFSSVEISDNFHYEISQSPDYGVQVSTHQNISEHLDVYQANQTVYIKLEQPRGYANTDAAVTIKMPELSSIKVTGAARGNVSGFESSRPLAIEVAGASQMDIQAISGEAKIDLSGASHLTGYIKAQSCEIKVSGASRSDLKGTVADATFEVSGASKVDAADLTARSADVQASGASQVSVNTDGKLNLKVSGSSTVKYAGHPEIHNMEVSGASHVQRE